jgi:hypothetical protein
MHCCYGTAPCGSIDSNRGIVEGSGTVESSTSCRQAKDELTLQRSCHSVREVETEGCPDSSRFEIAFKSDPEREKRADIDEGAKSSSKRQFDDIVKVVSG